MQTKKRKSIVRFDESHINPQQHFFPPQSRNTFNVSVRQNESDLSNQHSYQQ